MQKKIVIIGAGYVGLPLAIELAKKFHVFCYDIDKVRVNELQRFIDRNNQHKKKEINNTKLIFTTSKDVIKNKDIYIVTVPTPINSSNQPDLSHLSSASTLVGESIKKNSLIIYESTTYPGCTEDFCLPIIEKYSRLKLKNFEFKLAYSPERINPGDKTHVLNKITKVVGANDKKTRIEAAGIYKKICETVHLSNSIKIAESAKVIENIQRDINISLVNELSIIFKRLGISTKEVLAAASTKWNFHNYTPGLVGGHCIGVDPYYLSYISERKKYIPQLILSGRRINENMGRYIATQTTKLISENNKKIYNARVAILGLSFKENISDMRNTKVIDIIEELSKWSIKATVVDNRVSKKDAKKNLGLDILKFSEIKRKKFDAIILAVAHKEFVKKLKFYNKFFNSKKKIMIDVKNIFEEKDLIKNNYIYFQL